MSVHKLQWNLSLFSVTLIRPISLLGAVRVAPSALLSVDLVLSPSSISRCLLPMSDPAITSSNLPQQARMGVAVMCSRVSSHTYPDTWVSMSSQVIYLVSLVIYPHPVTVLTRVV